MHRTKTPLLLFDARERRSLNLPIAVLIGTRARRQVERLTKKVSVVPADAGGPGRQAVSL
jgi:hypothetical protein